jgi:hypothetical protein
MDELTKKRFLWGALLAWMPIALLLTLVLPGMYREFANQKQTGLGAIAGRLSEYFLTFGLVAALAFSIISIVMLLRSFSRGHWIRSLFSALSICLSLMLIAMFSLYVWVVFFLQHRS